MPGGGAMPLAWLRRCASLQLSSLGAPRVSLCSCAPRLYLRLRFGSPGGGAFIPFLFKLRRAENDCVFKETAQFNRQTRFMPTSLIRGLWYRSRQAYRNEPACVINENSTCTITIFSNMQAGPAEWQSCSLAACVTVTAVLISVVFVCAAVTVHAGAHA